MSDVNQVYGPLNSEEMITAQIPNKRNFRMIFVTIIVLLIAALGYAVLSNPELKAQAKRAINLSPIKIASNSNTDEIDMLVTEVKDRKIPWLEMRSLKSSVNSGEEFTIGVYGFSGGRDVVGFDILIGIDQNAFEVKSITSQLSDYIVRDFNRESYFSITGIKNPQKNDVTILDNTALLTVVLKAKQKGESMVTLLASEGNERTKYVDNNVAILTPQLGSVLINVK